jgi:hypothetical protein
MEEPEEALPDREGPEAEARSDAPIEPAEEIKEAPPLPRPTRAYPPRPKR